MGPARAILLLLMSMALPVAARAGDAREIVKLTPAAAEELRAGMRTYLESVQGVVEGLAASKPQAITEAATRSGEKMLGANAIAAGLSMPAGLIAMSLDTHRKFDDLARAATSGMPRLQLLAKLNDILANCTSCHAAYRLAP